MNAKANLALLNTNQFDSGALGMMAMVIHPFTEAGQYRGSVLRAGKVVGDLTFLVDESSTVMQLDIDLATVGLQKRQSGQDCDCHATPVPPAKVVSPRGFVLFYASGGSGYAVNVSHASGKTRFDSGRLEKGDLFALSLLEPAQYEGTNALTQARIDVAVEMLDGSPKELKARFAALETANITVGDGGFKPEKLRVVSAQGVVFQINEPSRIVIRKKADSGQSRERVGPKARWRKSVVPAARGSEDAGTTRD